MAITAITPVGNSVVAPGDSFSFTIDDTYTALAIKVPQSGGDEYAYDVALGGAQVGYTVAVVDNGSTHTFTVSRDAGFNLEPTVISVTEDETGAVATTTFSYYLTNTKVYPEGMQPYTNPYAGSLIVTEDDVQRRDDVGWIDFDDTTMAVTDMGDGKVRVATASGGGDVVGPASAVDDRVAVFDGTSGKLIKDGGTTIAALGGIGQLHRQWTGYYSGLGNTTWETWDQFDGVDDVTWTTNAGAVGSDPSLNFIWNNPHFTRASTLNKVRIYAHAGTTSSVTYELWRFTTTDSMSSTPAGTLVASGTDSVISNRTHIIDLTIADASIPENSAVQLFAKKDSAGAMSLKVIVDLEWTE